MAASVVAAALSYANNVANGVCGLSDGSRAGDWRLPNRNELTSLLDLNQAQSGLAKRPSFHEFPGGQVLDVNCQFPGQCVACGFPRRGRDRRHYGQLLVCHFRARRPLGFPSLPGRTPISISSARRPIRASSTLLAAVVLVEFLLRHLCCQLPGMRDIRDSDRAVHMLHSLADLVSVDVGILGLDWYLIASRSTGASLLTKTVGPPCSLVADGKACRTWLQRFQSPTRHRQQPRSPSAVVNSLSLRKAGASCVRLGRTPRRSAPSILRPLLRYRHWPPGQR